jgi:hypothetical protein
MPAACFPHRFASTMVWKEIGLFSRKTSLPLLEALKFE